MEIPCFINCVTCDSSRFFQTNQPNDLCEGIVDFKKQTGYGSRKSMKQKNRENKAICMYLNPRSQAVSGRLCTGTGGVFSASGDFRFSAAASIA